MNQCCNIVNSTHRNKLQFHSRKCISNGRQRNGGHFVSASMCKRKWTVHIRVQQRCVLTWLLWYPGPCITNVIATCRKNFSQWESSFLWKLRCHWLKFLRRVAKTLVIQGPGNCSTKHRQTLYRFKIQDFVNRFYSQRTLTSVHLTISSSWYAQFGREW